MLDKQRDGVRCIRYRLLGKSLAGWDSSIYALPTICCGVSDTHGHSFPAEGPLVTSGHQDKRVIRPQRRLAWLA